MRRRGLDAVRKVLAILPLVQNEQGIRVSELSRLTGIPEEEIVTDLPNLVNLCGVPPYSPMDLVDLEIEGDRVTIRFAEPFRRPVRLTIAEALALFMALSREDEDEESPFGRAIASIRGKVRAALSPEIAKGVEQAVSRISAVDGPGRAVGVVGMLNEALSRNVEVIVEYFSMSSGSLTKRRVRPYGIYERNGHFYLVGHSEPPDRVVTFRADRMRRVELTEVDYEIPADFDVAGFRRESLPKPDQPEIEARIRFDMDAARWAREFFPATSIAEEADGGATATVLTSGRFWLLNELLKWGGRARVEAPDGLAADLVERAKATLKRYGREG
jgi:predicted DNA-binding transcriptional regulator YafY